MDNILLEVALQREKKDFLKSPFLSPSTGEHYKTFSSTFSKLNKSPKNPVVESAERNFNEYSRFYSTYLEDRRHGKKFVPKPFTENLQ